jgi:hypothetical protein
MYTRRQMEALAVEAQKIGIPVYGEKRERIRHFTSVLRMTWRYESVIVRGKSQGRYRDLKTGRFIKKP